MTTYKHSFEHLHRDDKLYEPQEVPNKRTFFKILGVLLIGFILGLIAAVIIYESVKRCCLNPPPSNSSLAQKPPKKVNKTIDIDQLYYNCMYCGYEPSSALAKLEFPKCKKRVIGYFDFSEKSLLKASIYSKLTHIIFGTLEWFPSGRLEISDSPKKEKFEILKTNARQNKVKLMLSMKIGHEIILLKNSDRRELIIYMFVEFVQKHELNGIDIDWKLPLTVGDEQLVISLSKEMREQLTIMEAANNRTYIISMSLQKEKSGINVKEVLKYVNFLNIKTDFYYSPSHSDHPDLVGPPAPLYSGHPGIGNVDSTIKYYSCVTKAPHRLNMQLNFGGNLFRNVKNSSNSLCMTAGKIQNGQGYIGFGKMMEFGWNTSSSVYNEESKTSYIWKSEQQEYLAYDGLEGLKDKVWYAITKNIGGYVVSNPGDDNEEGVLMRVATNNSVCNFSASVEYDCEDE